MNKALLALPLIGLCFAAAPAQAREARCVITGGDGPIYTGPCDFAGERGGSFTVTSSDGGTFAGDVAAFRVDVDGDDGDVHSITTRGGGSSLGTVSRSDNDRACWNGDDISICAY